MDVFRFLLFWAIFTLSVRADLPQEGSQNFRYEKGFNYLGLQVLGAEKGRAKVASVSGVNVVLENLDGQVSDGRFIFEVRGGEGDGIVTTCRVSGNTVVTDDDLSSGIDQTSLVRLREIQTLASVFGAANRANLASAGSFALCDQVWLLNSNNYSFDKYAYLKANPFSQEAARWEDSLGNVVDPETVAMIYTDGIIINAVAAHEFTLIGCVKTGKTSFAISPGFNFLSSVYPVGLTLGGSKLEETMVTGSLVNPQFDQLWIPDGMGGFKRYAYLYYDPFSQTPEGWMDSLGNQVDPDAIPIHSSGLILLRSVGGVNNVIIEAPSL